jgi:hypothetical protein
MLPAAMKGGVVKARAGLALAAIAAAIVAVGCGSSDGGSDSSSTVTVTVQTGSLSKAAFVKKADAICKAARTEFLAEFASFSKEHLSEFANPKNREEIFKKVLETMLGPNVEGQIEQISKLGAPSSYAPEVETFLNALQKRIDKAQEEPLGLIATPYPFKKAENVAKQVGLQGCSESFS